MEYKVCTACKTEKHVDNFYKSKQIADGYNQKCKDCCYEYKKRLGISPPAKQRHYEASVRWRKKNRDKHWAHYVLRDWVKEGRVIRSPFCYDCGLKSEKIEGHHDDYTKPIRVHWLCKQCHEDRHHKGIEAPKKPDKENGF